MRKAALSFLTVAIVLATPRVDVSAQDTQTLTGEWVWYEASSRGTLESVFTPTRDGEWNVAFHFTFRGRAHVFTGTARGSLSDGALEGTVLNDTRKRTFTFSGTFTNGTFQGTHAEIEDGRAYEMGTLTLNR